MSTIAHTAKLQIPIINENHKIKSFIWELMKTYMDFDNNFNTKNQKPLNEAE